MSDPTENVRRQMTASINAVEGSREYLEQQHGVVYDTQEMQELFQPLSFAAHSSSSRNETREKREH